MSYDSVFLRYVEQAYQRFSGDFSFITGTGRMQTDCLPWSYGSRLLFHMKTSNRMLDMGKGGGEFLSLMRPFPSEIYATEAYEPNIPIAKERLQPFGVQVVGIEEDSVLPFPNAYFDLIANQHESFSGKEISRILRKKGIFITQQVGGLDCKEMNALFDVPLNGDYSSWNLQTAQDEIKKSGLVSIYGQETFPIQRFYDVGALIYYLKAIPWKIPDFSVNKYFDVLYKIHTIIQTNGYLDVTQHRFIIVAEAI